jgi:hypothetical protein
MVENLPLLFLIARRYPRRKTNVRMRRQNEAAARRTLRVGEEGQQKR